MFYKKNIDYSVLLPLLPEVKMRKSCLKHFKYQTCFNSIKTLLSGFEKSETGFEPSTLRLSFKGGRRKKGMAALHVSVTTQLFKLTRRAVPTRTLQHAAWSCTCTTAGSIARCALRTLPSAGRPGMTFFTHPKSTIWRFLNMARSKKQEGEKCPATIKEVSPSHSHDAHLYFNPLSFRADFAKKWLSTELNPDFWLASHV